MSVTTRYQDGEVGYVREREGYDPEVMIPDTLLGLTEDSQSAENAIIAQSVLRCWEKESRHYDPYDVRAAQAWDLYHMTWDESEGKEEWQSQRKFPFYLSQVERFVSLLTRMLDSTPNWFEIEALIPQHQVYMDIAKNFIKFLLEQANFRSTLSEAMRSGLITGQMHTKLVYTIDNVDQMGQEQKVIDDTKELSFFKETNLKDGSKPFVPNPDIPRLSLENMPATDVRLDSKGLKRYRMWRLMVPRGELYDLTDKSGYDTEAVLRAIQKAGARDGRISNEEGRRYIEQNLGPDGNPSADVALIFFEGTLPHDTSGDLLFKDKLCIVAGDELIYGPAPTPWWDGEGCIVSSPFIPVPNCVYGKSLLTESVDAFDVENETLNLLIDYCQVAVYGVWEQDVDKVDQEKQRFSGKIYPGVLYEVENNGSGQPATRRIPIPGIGADFAQFWQIFTSTIENTTGGANQLGGASRARGRITGQEFQTRNADSGALIQSWFEEIERNYLSPLVRLTFLRGLQFIDDNMWKAWVLSQMQSIIPSADAKDQDPNIVAQWKETLTAMADWTNTERFRRLGSFIRAKVTIFSSLAERQMMLEKASFLIKQVAQIPGAINYLRMDVVLTYLVRAIGWDPEKVLKLNLVPLPSADFDEQGTSTAFGEFTNGGEEEGSDMLDLSGGLMSLLNPPQAPPMQPNMGQPNQKQMNASPLPGGPSKPTVDMPQMPPA